jgi:hypothetical protein
MAQVTTRGSFGFEVDASGTLLSNAHNVDALRRMWSDRTLVSDVGPGVGPTGAWHVACHIVAAGCVRRAQDGALLWLEISHLSVDDRYGATLTHRKGNEAETLPLEDATRFLSQSKLLGFVEGNSEGHITARGVSDPPGRFGIYQRQNYDHLAGEAGSGGRVWEHWCTTRDLEATSPLSVSLLMAYVQLCHAAGDLFAPTVARGRRTYGHPEQLRAMIAAGFTSQSSATWPITPKPIPRPAELRLQEAVATEAFAAADSLAWSEDGPRYYMYARKIGDWAG